jgi:hypothetical protein
MDRLCQRSEAIRQRIIELPAALAMTKVVPISSTKL